MKYAVIGHTGDIGKALVKRLPNFKGFSKSNGYDLVNREKQVEAHSIFMKVIDEIVDYDVIFNLAHDNNLQSNVLTAICGRYNEKNITIVSVGSDITEIELPEERAHLKDYQFFKKKLKSTSILLKQQMEDNPNRKVKPRYVSFGMVATEKMVKKNPKMLNYPHLTVEEAVERILDAAK